VQREKAEMAVTEAMGLAGVVVEAAAATMTFRITRDEEGACKQMREAEGDRRPEEQNELVELGQVRMKIMV
jgi:hypothetical protein